MFVCNEEPTDFSDPLEDGEYDLPFGGVSVEPPKLMNLVDYNLNSPLIADHVDAFVSYCKSGSDSHIGGSARWLETRNSFFERGVALQDLQGSSTYHPWLFRIAKKCSGYHWITEMIDRTNHDARETFEVIKAFQRAWIDVEPEFLARESFREDTLRYGEIFFRFYVITLMINCSSSMEARNLQRLTGAYMRWLPGEQASFTWRFADWGTVYMANGCAVFQDGNQYLDRSMVLMAKDVFGGRFQSCMHVEYKEDPPYPAGMLDDVIATFELGDNLINQYGSDAYKIIKLVEPTALEKIHQLSAASKPLLPPFTKFEAHLREAAGELESSYPGALRFLEKIHLTEQLETLITIYGSFRLWGHPFINYLLGLQDLFFNVTVGKEIDEEYANQLASDLAFKVISTQFNKHRSWPVDPTQLPEDHILRTHIENQSWPDATDISRMGNSWHELPLTRCFEIPDFITLSNLYSDKSHSPDYSEVVEEIIKKQSGGSIKSYPVLGTLKDRPAQNWPEFLQRINDEGLTHEELIIGLKAKEREIKDRGRFFALMSWSLREYFVVTEYLIKEFYIPLYSGLTMADDLNTVIDKMMKCTESQGRDPNEKIEILNIANHIDYSKWNNHQRKEGNNPVFRVMGQFLGYPNLFTRTHEFFQKSTIYYKDRPDLMTVIDGKIRNKTSQIVCWDGQAGGLEGLRQKGWSLVNLLCLARQAQIRNTKVRFLAQGDNQVVFTFYRVNASQSDAEKRTQIRGCVDNNNIILNSVRSGAAKLGLIINEDETLQSATLTVYGKVILYRGAFKSLTEKRLSRVLCTTNDQLPSLSSVAATVVTNCLTIANYSDDPLNAMKQYNWLGNFARLTLELHDPAIRNPGMFVFKNFDDLSHYRYKINFLYLDPSLGGVGGLSLLRFLIRQFPDPVTEGLTFWKMVFGGTINSDLQRIAKENGNPVLSPFNIKHFEKLLENPQGLNLPRGIAPVTMLQKYVREQMIKEAGNMKNRIVGSAVQDLNLQMPSFLDFLYGINPCFPRFLSEFRAATYYGMVLNILSLFENSRTFRKFLIEKQETILDKVIVKSEITSYRMLGLRNGDPPAAIWECSATQADKLRRDSWNRTIIGATIPHPAEMMGPAVIGDNTCHGCRMEGLHHDHVSVVVPYVFRVPVDTRGDFRPYLGSKTAENSSAIQPWEKTTEVPLIRRSAALKNAIAWFVEPDSRLANVIKGNLDSLTGEDSGNLTHGYRRTGSALHRFSCSRQSTGGFSAISPNLLTFMVVTTDTMSETSQANYDFLYQAVIIYAQVSCAVRHRFARTALTYHVHIKCLKCVREIEEVTLNSMTTFRFPQVHQTLNAWKPSGTPWFVVRPTISVPPGDWSMVFGTEQSFQVGRISGFHVADQILVSSREKIDLFPNVIARNIDPEFWGKGFVEGLIRACALSLTHKKHVQHGREYKVQLMASYQRVMNLLSSNTDLLALIGQRSMYQYISSHSHFIPKEYPVQLTSLHTVFSSFAFRLANRLVTQKTADNWNEYPILWIFSDFLSAEVAAPYSLSTQAMTIIYNANHPIHRARRERIQSLARTDTQVRSLTVTEMQLRVMMMAGDNRFTPSEMKHACRSIVRLDLNRPQDVDLEFGREHSGAIYSNRVNFVRDCQSSQEFSIPRVSNPTLSGLRLAKIATGGHIKLLSILRTLHITTKDFICGGDGSGGFTACLLRNFPLAKGIFNTLVEGHGVALKGTTPSPPPAIHAMQESVRSRCVNATTCWSNPSNLEDQSTWDYWVDLIAQHGLHIDLIVLDMQVLGRSDQNIVFHLKRFVRNVIIPNGGVVIYKSYYGAIMNKTSSVLDELGPLFLDVRLVQTQYTGSASSEVYAIFRQANTTIPGIRFVDREDLWKHKNGVFIFESEAKEFARALACYNQDTLSGVPMRFIPDKREMLTEMFGGLQLDATYTSHLSSILSTSNQHKYKERFLTALVRIAQSKIADGRDTVGVLTVPADTWLVRFFSLLLGTLSWISLQSRDLGLYQRLHKIFQHGLTFYWDRDYTTDQLVWSLQPGFSHQKRFRLDMSMGSIAKTISVLTQISDGYTGPLDWNHMRSVTYREFRVVGSDEFLFNYSGVYQILSGAFVSEDVGVGDFLDQEEPEAGLF